MAARIRKPRTSKTGRTFKMECHSADAVSVYCRACRAELVADWYPGRPLPTGDVTCACGAVVHMPTAAQAEQHIHLYARS